MIIDVESTILAIYFAFAVKLTQNSIIGKSIMMCADNHTV